MEEHEISIENEKKTLVIIILTVATMIAEVAFGYITKSMSLLADGYHMGTHALALGLTYAAYVVSRYFANSEKFPSGTQKIGTLAGYTSSLFLGFTGLWIICEAYFRIINPLEINFSEAILVAIIGLVVNGTCIAIMEGGHKHHHEEDTKDYNFMAAYYHILADALTSILAIIALICGKYLDIIYLDPIVGIIGGILIIRWATSLIKDTVKILIDMK
jgi:cation diffusion facilitator family transporter